MTTKTITVSYTCRRCGLKDTKCDVTAPEEVKSVATWLKEYCTLAVHADHAKKSPKCPSIAVDLKVPITGTFTKEQK